MSAHSVQAAWTWLGDRFEEAVRIEVGDDGRIARLERRGGSADRHLPNHALLPGFVNAHSHAFQRGLRGRGETFPAGAGSFWTWREAMYDLVAGLDSEGVYRWSRQAFDEMRRAGITTVGEFHYLHHDDPEALDFAFDDVVLDAAHDSGLRLVLLEAYYRTGGIDQPLQGAQRRFAVPDVDTWRRQLDRLGGRLRGPHQTLGAVAHSIRAAEPDEIAELHAEAVRRRLVFHMHLEEQRQEIETARARYGAGPLQLMQGRLDPGPETTAVHCTHSEAETLVRWAARGAHACICPLTEANLADGIADLPALAGAGASICLGTDSNARISMLEEMRWLEYAQRLARERRGVLRDDRGGVAVPLLAAATRAGATSLGVPAGAVAEGLWADFVTVDLDHPSLAGWSPETLAVALVLGAADECLSGTCVGGRWSDPYQPQV